MLRKEKSGRRNIPLVSKILSTSAAAKPAIYMISLFTGHLAMMGSRGVAESLSRLVQLTSSLANWCYRSQPRPP